MQTFPLRAPLSTRFSAAFAAVRITYTLLQFLAPLGGAAAAAPVPAAGHASAPAVQVALASAAR